MQQVCSICQRQMVVGPTIDQHHWIPKSRKGTQSSWIHKICHQKIHSVFTEKELAREYNTAEKICSNDEIKKFVLWLSNKNPEFFVVSKDTNTRKKKR